MEHTELVALLKERCPIAFDTSAVRRGKAWREVCGALRGLESSADLPAPRRFTLIIPSLVHAEALFSYRRRLGHEFDPALVAGSLATIQTCFQPFDDKVAQATSATLAEWFPDEPKWQAAKLESLRLRIDDPGLMKRRVSATVDWHIAAHAQSNGWLLIVDDEGPEFRQVLRRANLDELAAAVRTLAGW